MRDTQGPGTLSLGFICKSINDISISVSLTVYAIKNFKKKKKKCRFVGTFNSFN